MWGDNITGLTNNKVKNGWYKDLSVVDLDRVKRKQNSLAKNVRRDEKDFSSLNILNSRNKIQLINKWVVAALRHEAGIVRWIKNNIKLD